MIIIGEEMKPCPFCEAGMSDYGEAGPVTYARIEGDSTFVKCKSCGAQGPSVAGDQGSNGPIGKLAKKAWNTRSPEAVTDEIEELKQALANTLALAKLKWGNLDEDVNVIFKQADAALLKVTR